MTTQGYAGFNQTLQALKANEYAGCAVLRRVRRVIAHVCANLHISSYTYLINLICVFLFHIRGFNPAYPAYLSTSHVNKGLEATQGLFQPCASLRN
jgi:hypothetical protein